MQLLNENINNESMLNLSTEMGWGPVMSNNKCNFFSAFSVQFVRQQISQVKIDGNLNGVLCKKRKSTPLCSLSGWQARTQDLNVTVLRRAIDLLGLCTYNTILHSASSSEAHGLPRDFRLTRFLFHCIK